MYATILSGRSPATARRPRSSENSHGVLWSMNPPPFRFVRQNAGPPARFARRFGAYLPNASLPHPSRGYHAPLARAPR
ncbi:hypothetical protein GCM10010513_55010 [Streptomyces glebosus]|nr:hypothetical protein GCM10010513_55010 [Streptomyces glebosus]